MSIVERVGRNANHQKIAELKGFKEKHGHLNVSQKEDKSLSVFCANVRQARRGRTLIKPNED